MNPYCSVKDYALPASWPNLMKLGDVAVVTLPIKLEDDADGLSWSFVCETMHNGGA